jgi:hypothetical protein
MPPASQSPVAPEFIADHLRLTDRSSARSEARSDDLVGDRAALAFADDGGQEGRAPDGREDAWLQRPEGRGSGHVPHELALRDDGRDAGGP